MSKLRRLMIVIAVIALAFMFLFPSIQWYFLTPKEDQAIAVGSREQIREYSRRMTYLIISDLKQRAATGDTTDLSNQKNYKVAIDSAKRAYSLAKKPAPRTWDAVAILSAFSSERSMFDTIESRYREYVLKLKNVHSNAVQLGLDLAGGMSAVVQADLKGLSEKLGHELSQAEKEDAMKRAVEILNSRIDKFGLTEPVIRRQGEDQIYIEIPGTPDPERINSIIMGKGNLAFYIADLEASAAVNSYLSTNPVGIDEETMTVDKPGLVPEGKIVRKVYKKDSYGLDEFTGEYLVLEGKPGLDGSHIVSATVSSDPITGQPETNFVLDKEGGDIFYELTSANVGKTMAVVLDDRVKSYARIQEPIRESVRITGFSAEEAEALALLLRTAALPISLSVVSQQSIGASLGEDAISQGQNAIIVGILSIFVFMFIYYKWAGINATIAQILNVYLMLSVLTAFKLTLTLPSIAGFVLTTGMAVDANVIIFERIKEEMKAGKSRAAAIHAGFDKAFWAVMDSNITTIIAALFLAQLGTGPIQGFAVSLAIGNITSLFTSLFVSRLIFDFETDVLKLKTVSISWRIR
ncbi:MAG TPA: protein translocase subunit SecD [Rectinema sp.]|jgi:preprotein translocase subunit SecD|nr:protein translocase subunit SecD [Spirochaetota bacterium]OQC74038.1 MAG: preprotein translocase subunit SecD [Spirochaetes bacterium ADurb.Bin001]HNP93011.1 protein translocase subunit SecD [Rectinema sp.]HNT59466.1 protein translocase subunit SecD [Rectinema sp.]HOC27010.1 protein translocase subunit SecD [Rectinema sp.]